MFYMDDITFNSFPWKISPSLFQKNWWWEGHSQRKTLWHSSMWTLSSPEKKRNSSWMHPVEQIASPKLCSVKIRKLHVLDFHKKLIITSVRHDHFSSWRTFLWLCLKGDVRHCAPTTWNTFRSGQWPIGFPLYSCATFWKTWHSSFMQTKTATKLINLEFGLWNSKKKKKKSGKGNFRDV